MAYLHTQGDEWLVSSYARGNNEAFDTLLNRHSDRLFSYIFYIVKDRDLANDIFQDTFIKAITHIKQGRYAENGKFFGWISRIAHNLIIDHYRQCKSGVVTSNDACEADILNNCELCEETVEDRWIVSQIHTDVRRLVDALPENQREVLVMRYYQELSYKEIADKTAVSINTALGRMRYALLNLRRMAEENRVELTL